MKLVLSTMTAKFSHSSLALKYLEKSCRREGLQPVVKEYTINTGVMSILADLFGVQPDILGLACHIWNMEATLALVGLIKKVLPNTIVVLGGPEVTYDAGRIMDEYEEVDFIILGEGEEAFPSLIKALQSGLPVDTLPGIAWRCGNEIYVGTAAVVNRLDTLPFPYEDSDMLEVKDKIIYYESSRGCPFSCQYCLSSATRGVRFLSLERVFSDMDFFLKHGVRQVKFVDRTFNAKREHYVPILQYLAAASGNTNFHFEISAELLDDQVLEFLQTVPKGRFQFEIGVQSTNLQTLDAIQRKCDWTRLAYSVKKLRTANNIHLHLDLIAGLPFESYQQFGKSFNDVYALRPHMLQLGFLKLLKGSGIRQSAVEHGYIYMDMAPYEVLGNNYMSYAELRQLKVIEDLVDKFHNSGRFAIVLTYIIDAYQGDAFSFFHDTAMFWQERGLDLLAHSTKNLYCLFEEFIRQNRPHEHPLCLDMLKFDVLYCDSTSVKPDFLLWDNEKWNRETTAFWRNEALVRNYVPDYTFTTWRDIKKKYHIEVFRYTLTDYFTTGEVAPKRNAILFCYADRATTYQVLNDQDFWTEEK